MAPQEEVRDLILAEGRIRCFVTPTSHYRQPYSVIKGYELKERVVTELSDEAQDG